MEVGRDHQRNPREAAKWFQKARKYPTPTRLPCATSAALCHAPLSAMNTSWCGTTSGIPARQQSDFRKRVRARPFWNLLEHILVWGNVVPESA